MRELYAVELRPSETSEVVHGSAQQAIAEWATRPFDGLSASDVLKPGEFMTPSGRIHTLSGKDGGWVLRWWQENQADPSLDWLIECAVTGPDDPPRVTVRIRIGQREGTVPRIGRLAFEFRSPAIVRTLLRNLTVFDAGERVIPVEGLVSPSMVDRFVQFLSNPRRALPVVLLSGNPSTGLPVVDTDELARQMAGLAHIRSLTADFASRKLTDAVGAERSVWWGAARIYWPGFTPSANPYEHKLWYADRLRDPWKPPLVEELRRWLGGLGSARTQPHPSIKAATAILGDRANELPEWVNEYVESVEDDKLALERELSETQMALAEAEDRIVSLEEAKERLRRSIHQIGWAVSGQGSNTEVPVQADEDG